MMKRLSIACIVLLLAACASYQAMPISATQNLSSFESRTLNDPAFENYLEAHLPRPVGPWPPKAWDLQMLTLAAFYYHPDLDVARARRDVANAKTVTAGAIPNPAIGFTPQYDSPAGGLSPWTLGFVLDLPIETAGKRAYRVSGAGHLSEAARLEVASAAWRVRSALRAAFVDLYAAREREKLLANQYDIQMRTVKVLEIRLSAGEASQPDVTLARLALDRTRLAVEDAARRRAEAQAGLARALGLPLAAVQDLPLSYDEFHAPLPKPPARQLRSQALRNRPDLLAALARYAASQSALQLEIARQYPDLTIGPGYKWAQGTRQWSLGISLMLPLFNQNQGPIAEANAGRRLAAANFTALQAQVLGEIDRSYAGFTKALNKLAAADRLLARARRQLESSRALFDAGEADRIALLGAEREIAANRLARLDTLIQAQQALGLLEDAVQMPLDAAIALPEAFAGSAGRDQEMTK